MNIKLGILGGLGPAATANFMNKIIEMTDATKDQEHIDMLVFNVPSIPDRTAFIKEGQKYPSPLSKLTQVAKALETNHVETIAIPCVTAHYFYEEVSKSVSCKVLNLVEETAKYLNENGVQKVGIMATDGTVDTGLFQRIFKQEKIEYILPSIEQQRQVMDIIYGQIKQGLTPDLWSFKEVSQELFSRGAEVIILACTELSIIKNKEVIGPGYLDVIDVLAMTCVKNHGKLKENYKELIS